LLENGGRCTYMVSQKDNIINLSYSFEIGQIIYPKTDYNAIRDYFGLVASKNNEMIVLKKI